MTNHIDKKNHWQKDFNGWNSRKQKLNARKLSLNFKERDIWYMSVGTNIDSETGGKNYKYERPVLIMRKFSQNTFLGVPLTSKNVPATITPKSCTTTKSVTPSSIKFGYLTQDDCLAKYIKWIHRNSGH